MNVYVIKDGEEMIAVLQTKLNEVVSQMQIVIKINVEWIV